MGSITRHRDRDALLPATSITVKRTVHGTRVRLLSQESIATKWLTVVLPDPRSPGSAKRNPTSTGTTYPGPD
jgi:hypothetical protein